MPPSKPKSVDELSSIELRRVQPNPAEWRLVRRALEEDSPRSAALLAAAHLDFMLEGEIADTFYGYARENNERLFGPSAPLSSTEAKVNLAYAIGFFGDVTKNDLQRICKIRNIFAHSGHSISFETQAISNLCFELRALQTYREQGIPHIIDALPELTNARVHFINSAIGIPMTIWSARHKKEGYIEVTVNAQAPLLP